MARSTSTSATPSDQASGSCAPQAGIAAFSWGGPYLESHYFGDGFKIAFLRGNKRLKRQLDYALGKLTENGTMRELYLRYFPLGYY